MTGLTYAVLAAGLVLVYRATRVINFAYGEIGALGAGCPGEARARRRTGTSSSRSRSSSLRGRVGAAVELRVVRRLFEAPRLIVLVATIGVSQVMFFALAVLPGSTTSRGTHRRST